MIESIRSRMTFANVTSLLALFIALGGTSYAALNLPKNSVGKRQLKAGSVNSKKVENRSLRKVDFARGQLTAGPRGPIGPQGAPGPPGQNGSPDTPDQVLEKLLTVDGPGSELDADTVDGKTAGDFVPNASGSTLPAVGVRFYSYFMDTATTNRLTFGQMAIEAAGAAGQFKICGNTGGPGALPYVLYLNGVRTTGSVAGNGCTGAYDAAAGGEFRVTVRRSIVFGVHSGDSPTNENYNVYGFGQL